MVNILKLKAKLVETANNVESLAKYIGIDRSTLYRRLDGGGQDFTIGEADKICQALSLTAEEANRIFFSQYVACDANPTVSR